MSGKKYVSIGERRISRSREQVRLKSFVVDKTKECLCWQEKRRVGRGGEMVIGPAKVLVQEYGCLLMQAMIAISFAGTNASDSEQ